MSLTAKFALAFAIEIAQARTIPGAVEQFQIEFDPDFRNLFSVQRQLVTLSSQPLNSSSAQRRLIAQYFVVDSNRFS